MAIAEHQPEKLYEKNKGMAKMTKSQLHDFASTPEKELPKKVSTQQRFERKRMKQGAKRW